MMGTSRVQTLHQENMSMQYIPPYTPLLDSETGVYTGIPNFLMSLWVLFRTASLPTINVLSKNTNIIKNPNFSKVIFNFHSC